jgi:TLC domain
MFRVYVAKIYDKHNLLKTTNDEDLAEKIPSFRKGQLQIFSKTMVDNVEIPSFMMYLKKTKLMVFHHLFIGFYGLIVISSWRKGLGDCIFSFFFMMEFSTPSVPYSAY